MGTSQNAVMAKFAPIGSSEGGIACRVRVRLSDRIPQVRPLQVRLFEVGSA